MHDEAITIRRLGLKPKQQHPLVWVSRIAIFGHYNPPRLIRDVPLHRGLNIVWGIEEAGEMGDVEVDGHGVGKTTFCRLIRYCLGEKHFARPETRDRIRATFPNGYVAANIHVDGQIWSVARPIGKSKLSYARRDSTIEDVLTNRPSSASYAEFCSLLEEVALRDLLVGATIGTNEPIRWDHILAWCSRDQECRFQSLWEWRSSRSASETPQFKKPKVAAILMLRAMLRLLHDEDVKVEEQCFTIFNDIQKLEAEIADRQREPEFWRRFYRNRFVTEYGIEDAMTASIAQDAGLFNVPARVKIKRTQIVELVQAQTEQLKKIDRELAVLAAQLGDLEQLLDLDAATAETKAASASVTSNIAQERRKWLDELRRVAPFRWCKYGEKTLQDCSHVQDVLNEAATKPLRTTTADLRVIARGDQISAAATERLVKWQQMVKSIKERREALLTERQAVEEKKNGLLAQMKDLDDSLGALRKWESYFTKDVPDPELLKLHGDLATAEHKHQESKAKLVKLLESHAAQRSQLIRVYDGAVKSILSPTYHGRLELRDEDLLFKIAKGDNIGGEALETLAILLADVSALLLGAEDRCLHPGILLHDSPREADLGSRIYQSFLGFLRELHDALGGDSTAPFQYILTTTTPPPTAVQNTNSIVLPLSAATPEGKGLLFGRQLMSPDERAAADQESFFGHDDE